MLPTVTSFLFFVGVLAFVASDLGGGAGIATATGSSPDWLQESVVAAHTNSRKTGGGKCGKDCITITGGQVGMKGIPRYTAEITNNCDVCVSNIQLNCANFSSSNVILSRVLKRISPDHCLVDGGRHVASGNLAASFHYDTTFPYHFTVYSVTCHC